MGDVPEVFRGRVALGRRWLLNSFPYQIEGITPWINGSLASTCSMPARHRSATLGKSTRSALCLGIGMGANGPVMCRTDRQTQS